MTVAKRYRSHKVEFAQTSLQSQGSDPIFCKDSDVTVPMNPGESEGGFERDLVTDCLYHALNKTH